MYQKNLDGKYLKIVISPSFDNIEKICQDAEDFSCKNGFNNILFEIQLGIREILTNAIRHGCKSDVNKQIEFKMERNKGFVHISSKDGGDGFDWQKEQKKNSADLLENGRGMKILKTYFDRIQYNESGNEITITKKINDN